MSHQIIRKPDGRLAVFSSVVDDWIFTDAEPEELENYYAGEAAGAALRRTREIITQVLAGEARKVYHQFAMTYEEADALAKHDEDEDEDA